MLKKLLLIAVAFFAVLQIGGTGGHTQSQIGVPVKVEGFIFDFRTPFEQISVELGKNLVDTAEVVEFQLTPATVYLNNKNKPLDKAQLRIGLEVEIQGERLNGVITVKSIKAKGDLEKDETVKGYFEGLDKLPEGEVAWISGQTVRLAPGAVVRGDKEWKGRSFNSFNEMMLGSLVEVSGRRQADGILLARQGITKPNIFDKDDRRMRELVMKSYNGKFIAPSAGQNSGTIPEPEKSKDGKTTTLTAHQATFVREGKLTNHAGADANVSNGEIHVHSDEIPGTMDGQITAEHSTDAPVTTTPSNATTANATAEKVAAATATVPDKQWRVRSSGREFSLQPLPDYVTTVGNRLVPQYMRDVPDTDPGKLKFRFYVVNNDAFNAFSLPDGTVVIYTGLLRSLENESQLAAVLGHEMAHVTHEHSRREVERKIKLQRIALAATILGGANAGAIASIVGGLAALEYSRDLEDEADRVGLFYMAHAGYDPREAPKVWRRVLDKQGKQTASTTFVASTHSRPQDRLRNLNREIARNYSGRDFSQTDLGAAPFLVNAGLYFGWVTITAPAAPPARATTLAPKSGGIQKTLTPATDKPASPSRNPPVKPRPKKKP